jgi:hypothetical protein
VAARYFREWLFQLVVGLGVAGTIAAAALINKYWTWPTAVVGAVLLLCELLYLMERLGIGPSTRSRVRDWLDSSSYSIQAVQDTNQFHFVMTDNVGIRTNIFQVKADSPVTIISPGHKASPEQLAAFNSLDQSHQRAFWRNVRLELLRYGVQFSNLTLDGEGVAFSDNVLVSRSLTGTEFLKRILFVRSGARLYQELLLTLHDAEQRLPATAG